MKKLGTPIGAGPGSARLKVGSAGVGAPSGSRLAFLSLPAWSPSPSLAEPSAALTEPATSFFEPSTFDLALCLASSEDFAASFPAGAGTPDDGAGACGSDCGAAGAGWSDGGGGGGGAGSVGTSETDTIGVVTPGI